MAYEHLKRESDKKDVLIQDLLKKLNEALETIRAQSDQIKGNDHRGCYSKNFYSNDKSKRS